MVTKKYIYMVVELENGGMDNMMNPLTEWLARSPSHTLHGIFPNPVYIVNRSLQLSLEEDKDIEDIIKGGFKPGPENSSSIDSYIFDSKLKKIKQFCEQQIKIYVEKVIDPKDELEIYITQSWLNLTKPSESHHEHFHSNSMYF